MLAWYLTDTAIKNDIKIINKAPIKEIDKELKDISKTWIKEEILKLSKDKDKRIKTGIIKPIEIGVIHTKK